MVETNVSESITVLNYVYLIFQLAEKTYQFPIIWNQKIEKFTFNRSVSYAVAERVVLLVDIVIFISTLTVTIFAPIVGCTTSFIQTCYFISPIAVTNIIIDLNNHQKKLQNSQLLNAFVQYLHHMSQKSMLSIYTIKKIK